MTNSSNINNLDSKTKWPELVGKTAHEAKKIIELETAGKVSVYIVPQDSMITMDYCLDRVRIFEDHHRKVLKPPMIG